MLFYLIAYNYFGSLVFLSFSSSISRTEKIEERCYARRLRISVPARHEEHCIAQRTRKKLHVRVGLAARILSNHAQSDAQLGSRCQSVSVAAGRVQKVEEDCIARRLRSSTSGKKSLTGNCF